MIGRVDQSGKALVQVDIASRLNGPRTSLSVWIDTAFDGHLVMSTELIKDLELDSLIETEAILADGSRVKLESYLCYILWFGEKLPVQVIANEGRLPLLGTALLENRVLHIDYRLKTVVLE